MAENSDVDTIQKELDLLKKEYKLDVNNDAISRAKEEAKAEIMKELEAKKLQEAKDAETADLKTKLEQQQVDFAAKQEELQKKMDEMIASKQTINPNDPFQGNHTNPEQIINNMTDEDFRKLEEAEGERLFGSEYLSRMKEQ